MTNEESLAEFEAWWDTKQRASFAEAYGAEVPFRKNWGGAFKQDAQEAWVAARAHSEPKAAPTIEPRIFRGNGPDCLGCGKTLAQHLTNYHFCPGLPENRGAGQ